MTGVEAEGGPVGRGAAATDAVAEAIATPAVSRPVTMTRLRFLSFQLSSESGSTSATPPVPPALAPPEGPPPRSGYGSNVASWPMILLQSADTDRISVVRRRGRRCRSHIRDSPAAAQPRSGAPGGCGRLTSRGYPLRDERSTFGSGPGGRPRPPPGEEKPRAGGGDDRCADHRGRHHHRDPGPARDRTRAEGRPLLGDLGRDRLSAGDHPARHPGGPAR